MASFGFVLVISPMFVSVFNKITLTSNELGLT